MRNIGDIENNVLFGEDDWLFLWHGGQAQFDYLTGIISPSPKSVQSFVANLESRRVICDAHGVQNVHVVYPSKPVVMTRFLPEGIRSGVQSLFEHHYSHALNPEATTVLYPRQALIEASMTDQVFSRQDSHMTHIGNAIVAQKILYSFGNDHNIQACMKAETRPRRGDLADMVKIHTRLPETHLTPRQDSFKILDNRIFLPSNTDNIVIAHNPRAASSRRLLALGDSFLRDAISPLLTFYRDILFVRSELFQPDLLDSFAPDDVVTANAERYLSKVNLDSAGESVVMRCHGREDYKPTAEFTTALQAQLSARNYPTVYDKWAARIAATTFENMGDAQFNSQLSNAPSALGWLESTGHDPHITFSNVSMENGRDYQLRICMESNVEGTAQLFLGLHNMPFAEAFSVRKPIRVGLNEMVFNLAAEGRGRRLRFDPLNVSGLIRLVTMELVPHS